MENEKDTKALEVVEQPQLMTLGDAQLFAQAAYKSGLFTDVKSEAQALVKIIAGRELGIPAIMAMQKLYIVNNKIGMAAELMGALLHKAGYNWSIKFDNQDNPTTCEVTFSYGVASTYISRFTIKDAERASLIKPGGAWEKYPKDLLFSRAFTAGARKYAPEALGGIGYTPEELESIPVVEADTKEVKPVEVAITEEAIEVKSDAKPHSLEQFLKECPEHGDEWRTNKYKKRFHKMPDGSFCNFRDAIKPIAAEIVKAAGYDATTFITFLKDNYKKSWSQISEEEQIAILVLLDRKEENDSLS